MPDGKGTADEEQRKKNRFIQQDTRVAFPLSSFCYADYRKIQSTQPAVSSRLRSARQAFSETSSRTVLPPSAKRTEFTL